MDRWVVGRDEAEALEAAQQRFPGRPIKLLQVRGAVCGLLGSRCAPSCSLPHSFMALNILPDFLR